MDQGNEKKEEIDLSGAFNNSTPTNNFKNSQIGPLYLPGTPAIIRWVVKYSGGLVKNEQQASRVLICLMILTAAISFFLVLKSNSVAPASNVLETPGMEIFKNAPSELPPQK